METTKIKKKAGRISPTPMGDYDSTTVYRRLDWVYYGGTSYICKKNNTVGITPINISNWQKLLDSPIDAISDAIIYFDEVKTRETFSSGEKLSVILGKIKKCISDIKDVAFSGSYNDLSDTPNSLKNPNALNIKFNGTSQASYDGSATKEVNVTPSAISAVNTSTILTTKEEISANTNNANVTGALAAKAMMADYNNQIAQINSKLADKLKIVTILSIKTYSTGTEYTPVNKANSFTYFIPTLTWRRGEIGAKQQYDSTYDYIDAVIPSVDGGICVIRKARFLINKTTGAVKIEFFNQANLQSDGNFIFSADAMDGVGLLGINW